MKGLLDGDPLLAEVWVKGEMSNFRHHTASGHMYFTLKDGAAQVRAVMFRGDNQRLTGLGLSEEGRPWSPKDGAKVLARGNVSVYPRDGQYQLYVRELEPLGLGSLFLAYERLKKELAAEGLFDAELKRELPLLPRRVGVVTSDGGAALRDIITVARRRFRNIHLVLAPAAVQGPSAPAELVRALALLGRRDDIDVIILARGGGSIEELWAFNDEALARAIRASRHPVVTGIGHETDTTIADLAADRRAATPSNAAELAVPLKTELARATGALAGRLERALRTGLERRRRDVGALAAATPLAHPSRLFEAHRQRVDVSARGMEMAFARILEKLRHRRDAYAGRLDALSPLAVLGRGYALCRREPDGKVVSSVALVGPGGVVSVQVADGVIDCGVNSVRAEVRPKGGE